ncbi:MAG: hypothetical protein R3284_02730 [Rubricoccaceae bacterium]|nr:hypothetical protein [Rubricoccaceae bacterium]
MIRIVFMFSLVTLLISGCDAGDAQREFQEAAALPPSGIFRTMDGVNAIDGENDPDDWRTAPVYAGRFLVSRRAYPNPAGISDVVTIEVRVTGFNVVPGGIRVVGYTENNRRVVLEEDLTATSDGVYAFTFFGGDLIGSSPTGLRRIIIFDGQFGVMSYGDLQLTD